MECDFRTKFGVCRENNEGENIMQKKKLIAFVLSVACAVTLLGGCGSNGSEKTADSQSADASGDHPVITMNAPYRNMSTFVEKVHEKYPEINLEIIPYNG